MGTDFGWVMALIQGKGDVWGWRRRDTCRLGVVYHSFYQIVLAEICNIIKNALGEMK
jgi:hypothetical protein